MTRVSARHDGVPTEEMADYYAEFADGGFGLVVTEGIYPDAAYSQGYLNQPGLVTERARRGVAHGRRPRPRRAAAGSSPSSCTPARCPRATRTGAGPSRRRAVPPLGEMMPAYGGSGPFQTPREATLAEDLREVVDGFAAAARNAAAAGFDGVEVHGCERLPARPVHHRVHQPAHRRVRRLDGEPGAADRRDRRSGSPTRRRTGSRSECASRRPRSTTWSTAGPAGPTTSSSSRRRSPRPAPATCTWPARDEPGSTPLAWPTGRRSPAWPREVSGLPVIANGGMHDPEQAGRVLDDGHADFLSIGHAALANPDLPQRLATGARARVTSTRRCCGRMSH